MNKPNNKRRRDSQQRIEAAFVKLLQVSELSRVTVTEVCAAAQVNRTTFYANYTDIYDLADAVQRRLEDEVYGLFKEEREQQSYGDDFLRLFRHIKENQLFYKTYFKLGLDGRFQITEFDVGKAADLFDGGNLEYHMEFFRNGLNAVIKLWLKNDCRESPEEMYAILASEYLGREK